MSAGSLAALQAGQTQGQVDPHGTFMTHHLQCMCTCSSYNWMCEEQYTLVSEPKLIFILNLIYRCLVVAIALRSASDKNTCLRELTI